jgi:hypothetical protein
MYSVENVADWNVYATPACFHNRIGRLINFGWTDDVHNMDMYYAKADETFRKLRLSRPKGRPTLPTPPVRSRGPRTGR